ncbi:hypothetical protein SAMN05444372_108165 [Flavobacterium micromati]|jgi:hypothetical protein|uniref:Transmembrane protein n=1 Tax=Flavobacterium micromati TaxID=229205 RepID=A0A1M5LS01_9FLAO|nr:hypothetical protein [Flavobacterium micromati]SHG67409.1 hypothetical protein SAMN05444372_108165 [Flavobacterium micromati]
MKPVLLKKILPSFSYVFHPILIPAMATLLYLFYRNGDFITQEKFFILLQVVIVTIAIPLLVFVLLRAMGTVDTIMMSKISERKIPLVVHCFLLILLVKKSITIDRYPELHFFLLGGLFSIVLAMILLFGYYKASLHMIGISSLTVFITGMSMHFQINSILTVATLILLNGIIASSRLEMKAHTNKELAMGFFLGAIPQILLLVLWL